MKTLTSDVSASLFYRVAVKQRLQAQIDTQARLVYDIVYAFTSVFVWTGENATQTMIVFVWTEIKICVY